MNGLIYILAKACANFIILILLFVSKGSVLVPRTGLLMVCDVAISHNLPKIAAFHIIRQKSDNSGKIAKFEEGTRKYWLLT